MIRTCRIHGPTEHKLRKGGGFRCTKCAVEAVNHRRRKIKRELIEEFGGKCELCGYSKHPAALQFHHRSPEEKEFGISSSSNKGIDRLREEAKKCMLVCANCHAIIHAEDASLAQPG